MKNTGKRIIAALLVAVMLIGIAPTESLTGLGFSGLFGVKADAAKPVVILNDFSENTNVQTKSGYDTYHALTNGDIWAEYNKTDKQWWYTFTTDKVVVKVPVSAFKHPEQAGNDYSLLNQKIIHPLNMQSVDNDMRYMYKNCDLSVYDWCDNAKGTIYLAWLDFYSEYKHGDVTLKCHKNGDVSFTYCNNCYEYYNPHLWLYVPEFAKELRPALDYDSCDFKHNTYGDERYKLFEPNTPEQFKACLVRRYQYYGIHPTFSLCVKNHSDDNIHIVRTNINGYGWRDATCKEILKTGYKAYRFLYGTINAVMNISNPLGLLTLGLDLFLEDGFDEFKTSTDSIDSSGLETCRFNDDRIESHANSNKYCYLAKTTCPALLKRCNDYFETVFGLNHDFKRGDVSLYVSFGTLEEEATSTAKKTVQNNFDPLKDINRKINPVQTPTVNFSDLSHLVDPTKPSVPKKRAAASSNVTTDDRIVKATLSGKINNTNGIGLKYGVLLKEKSNQVTGKDIVWSNNNTTKNKTIPVSTSKSNLTPNTKYYYAIYAKADSGLYCSDIKSFVTPKVRPYETKINFVKTVNYRNGELMNSNELGIGDSVTIEWDGSLPKYAEWYKMEITHPDGTTEIKDQIKGTTATIQLTEEGTYHFRVRACNTAGESDWTTTDDTAIVWPDVTLTFMAGSNEIGYRTYESHTLTWNHDLETMPAVPARVGAVFCGWFREEKKSIIEAPESALSLTPEIVLEKTLASVLYVREDTVLYAGYKDTVFTVCFLDGNGNQIGEAQRIPYGEDAKAPDAAEVAVPENCKFAGWNHSLVNIVENLTIKAVVVKEDYALPVGIVNDGSKDSPTAVRHSDEYEINCVLRNETPQKDVRGRVIVAIKSEEGKLLTMTESSAYSIRGKSDASLSEPSTLNTKSITISVPIDLADDTNGIPGATAEIYAVESFKNPVPVSNAVVMTITNCEDRDHCQWTRWFSEPQPQYEDEDFEKEVRAEYRYQTYQQLTTHFMSEVRARNAVNAETFINSDEQNDGRQWVFREDENVEITYTDWSKEKPTPLEYSVVEERTVDDSKSTLYYLYKRYKYYNNGWWYSYGSSYSPNGTWEYKKTTSPLPEYAMTTDGKAMRYGNANSFWFAGNASKQGDYTTKTATVTEKTGSHKEYRLRNEIHTYYLSRWSDWSDWTRSQIDPDLTAQDIIQWIRSQVDPDLTALGVSENAVIVKEADEKIEMEDREEKEAVLQYRTFYRYKTSDLNVEQLSIPEEDRYYLPEAFCGSRIQDVISDVSDVSNYVGKQLTLYVYKYNEVADWTTEYVAQTTVEADGSFTFEQGILREKPTEETGDFTVILSIQGAPESICLGKIEAPKPKYNVTFMCPDKESGAYVPIPVTIDGTESDTQTVEEGGNAIVPDVPEIEGMTFLYWDMRSTDIHSDLIIYAKYVPKVYTVIFHDPLNEENPITYMRIPHGSKLYASLFYGIEDEQGQNIAEDELKSDDDYVCPPVSETPEWEFVQWDLIDPVTVTDPETEEQETTAKIEVTSDLVLTALYTPRVCDVFFMDIDAQETESAASRGVSAAAEETEGTEELHAVKAQEVRYGDTLTMTEDFVDDVDFGDDVVLLGWTADDDDDTLIDFDTYTITEDTYLTPKYMFLNTVETPTASQESGTHPASTTITKHKYLYKRCTYTINSTSYINYKSDYAKSHGIPYTWQFLFSNYRLSQDGEYEGVPEFRNGAGKWFAASSNTREATTYKGIDFTKDEAMVDEEIGFSVTLSTETENAVIYYTLDGSDPAESDTAIEYTGPIVITSSCVLRTIACKFNCNNSDEAAYVYAINGSSAPAQHVVTYTTYDFGLPLVQFLVDEGVTLDPSMLNETEGYTFDGAYRSVQAPEEDEEYPTFSDPWDFETDTVTEDVTLYLNYTANPYTVMFLDYNGYVLDEQEVTYGSSAEEPDAPEREGYVFVGWDTDAYEYVTGELEVNAIYVPESEYARVTLNRSKYTATQGTSFRLTADVTGNLENPTLIWSSSDENVAIVDDDGLVTTTGKGTADITVQIPNSTEYAVCRLTVLPNPNAELMLRSNSYLTMDDYGFIRGFTVYTDEKLDHFAPTVAEVRGEFANSDLVFERADGMVLTDDDFVGTGTMIRLMDGEQELDSVTVIISGDLNGDGIISTRDASMILQAIVNKIVLTDLQIAAADVNGDGLANNKDASMISRYLVGKSTL